MKSYWISMFLCLAFGVCVSDSARRCRRRVRYCSPLVAMRCGPREKLVYVTCINAAWKTDNKPDFLATIDLDPMSPTYSQIIHKMNVLRAGDELHHMGWSVCGNCRDRRPTRGQLILPGLNSERIYVVDTATDPRAPRIQKTIQPAEVHEVAKASGLHTAHCMPSGDVMISGMGDEYGNAKGTFVLLERGTFDVKGTWQAEEDSSEYNYDFSFKPRHNVMVSSEWAAPNTFRRGFYIQDVQAGLYGQSINVWDWTTRRRLQRIDLGKDGRMPLVVRFLHDPDASEGFVGCTLSSTIVRFYKTGYNFWTSEVVVRVPPKKVRNWVYPEMPGMITYILISLDDKYLYLSNWLHGDIRQYDISDTRNPKLVGQVFVGGSICKGGRVKVIGDTELEEQPECPTVRGIPVRGGPQMLQLSLDGKRLYVTNSVFSTWDEQFYPENIEKGSLMLLVHVNREEGGLTLDEDFVVDFGRSVLGHEMRFPGGDSTSDVWE